MASRTVLQLLSAAAEELEAIPSGGTLTTNEQASGLDRFNRLMDASSADRGLIFTERMDPLTLQASKQSYTIGRNPSTGGFSGDFAVDRPVRITAANVLLSTTVRRPVQLIEDAEWAAIRYQLVYAPPRKVYMDGGFSSTGLATMYFYPIPDQAYSFEMYSWQQNGQASGVNSAIDYPPGYADFWLYAMAIRLAPMFGRTVSVDLRESYREARERIVALNSISPMLTPDAALMARDGGLYNWLDGQVE
jgi:hypothetical protein